MVIRYLVITAVCFAAFAYFASVGWGYLATGVLGIWYFLVGAMSGGFGRKRPSRSNHSEDDHHGDDLDDPFDDFGSPEVTKDTWGYEAGGTYSGTGPYGEP